MNRHYDGMTPRILVRTTVYETRDCMEVNHVAFEAITPQGSVRNGPGYEREIIGFIEVEPYTEIGRYEDAAAFREIVEEVAEYVHLKPDHE